VYDTVYAHQDVEDDQRIGVRSTALRFGLEHSKVWLSGFSAACVALLALGGAARGLGPLFAATAVAGGGMQLAWLLTKVRLADRASCHATFVAMARFGWIVLAAIVADRLISPPEEKHQPPQRKQQPQPAPTASVATAPLS
jgi:4-hydroxybenzoate polyprenyltransferase